MLRRSALSLLALTLAGPAWAQPYPNKPITVIVPFAAGGPTDLMARIVGERMGKELGQQFIIDNVTGAAGTIAMGKLARSAPDGYTIGIGHLGTNVVNGLIYKKLNYDLLDDLVPIARLPSNPLLVVTSNQVPAKDLKELVSYLKENADKISGGTAGMGSGSHIGVMAFHAATGTNYQLVPYRGTGPAVQDLIAGNVSSTLDITTMAMVHAGKLRALAVASDRRYPREPTVPSFGESGLPGLELVTWLSLHGPAGLPPELVLRINADVNRALAMPEVKAGIEAMNLDPVGGSPADLQAMLGRERSRYAELIRQAGITVD